MICFGQGCRLWKLAQTRMVILQRLDLEGWVFSARIPSTAACAPAIVVQYGRRISSAVRRIENESAVPAASGVLITIAISPAFMQSTTCGLP